VRDQQGPGRFRCSRQCAVAACRPGLRPSLPGPGLRRRRGRTPDRRRHCGSEHSAPVRPNWSLGDEVGGLWFRTLTSAWQGMLYGEPPAGAPAQMNNRGHRPRSTRPIITVCEACWAASVNYLPSAGLPRPNPGGTAWKLLEPRHLGPSRPNGRNWRSLTNFVAVAALTSQPRGVLRCRASSLGVRR
jgi:hypothetical protein